jgi:hypothetical protein
MTTKEARQVCLFRRPAAGSCWGGTLMPEPVRILADYLDGKHATPWHVKRCLLELLEEQAGDVHVYFSARGFLGLVIELDGGPERGGSVETWRVLDFTPAAEPVRSCRHCGCTDELGCPDGCSWDEPDLCSQCV